MASDEWPEKRGKTVKSKAVLICFLLAVPLVHGQGRKTPKGFVPDSEAAVKIAEAALIPVYGKKKIESERPFTAELKDGKWTVYGTLRCPDGKGGTTTVCAGGVAVVVIAQADGRVLSMSHTK